MKRAYFIIIVIIAACSLLYIVTSTLPKTELPVADAANDDVHPISPYQSSISGVGIVKASSENIFIGVPVSRIVNKVYVSVGDDVKKGDPLLQLEDRDLQADLAVKQIAYETSLARLKRLELLPRAEDVELSEASLKNAQIELNLAKSQYEMVEGLQDSRAVSREETNRRRTNYEKAMTLWQQAQASFEKVKAGTWGPDLEIARLESEQARANVRRVKAEIDRTIVKSPINGKVLQIKINEGELTPVDTSQIPVMVVGNTKEKYLDVSINQFNATNFQPSAPAVAFLQGDARLEFPLEFVTLDPYLVNKKNLTNDIEERVDTRVLHVTYRFKNKNQKIYVGQQMDVFIESDK